MNILYLHGLDSKLSEAKRQILENYSAVESPDIDYYGNPDSVDLLWSLYANRQFDVIIGSSMGGFAGWHLAKALKVPALLFNPALARRSVQQNIPDFHPGEAPYLQIVMGLDDELIPPSDTLSFLIEQLNDLPEMTIHLRQNLGHRIPVEVFEEEVGMFFGKNFNYHQMIGK